MKSESNQKYIVFVLIFVALLYQACGKWQENELAQLQRAFIYSDSENERNQIVNRLEKYLTDRAVPDSIERELEHNVDSLILVSDTNNQSISNYQDVKNIYNLENDFYDLLKSKIYIRANQNDVDFNNLDSVAVYLDNNLKIQYWSKFLHEIRHYSPKQAKCWIFAENASQQCEIYYDSFNQIKTALNYATLGLKYLNQVNDTRIKLDIIQRVQYSLYKYYGFYELSIALANRYLEQCNSIGYKLRTNGLLFNVATAFYEAGKLSTALRMFRKIVLIAEQNDSIPSMNWYLNNGLINIANTYYWSGEYAKAWAVCDSVERIQLTDREKLIILMNRGLINRDLGHYDDAETHFTKALKLAESTKDFENKIKMLNNFGFLFLKLSEYHKALKFFEHALKDLETCSPDSRELKITLLINIADVYAKLGENELVEKCLKEARFDLEYLGEYPMREADLLNTIGKFQMDIKQYSQANEVLIRAETICEENGLVNLGLDIKLNLANSFILLLNHNKAEKKISEVLSLANDIDDNERIIDAYAALARLAAVKGNVNKAVQISNRMIKVIDILAQKFKNTQRLIAYQQKINDYLKEAIVYELNLNRLDSALVKLDYTKSLVYTRNDSKGKNTLNPIGKMDLKNILSHMEPNIQIINYLLTKNTLYMFCIHDNNIIVHSKNIDYDSLKSKVVNYIKNINHTIAIFKNYDPQKVDEHFQLTTYLGQELYNILIDDEIINRIINPNSILYIIPDDFLHFLPFATLVTEKKSEALFLIEKSNITYLPGLFSFQDSSNIKRESTGTKVLLAVDPEMVNMKKLTSLVNHLYPETQLFGNEIEALPKQEMLAKIENNFDMYIFAGHSYADSRNIDNSYIDVTAISNDFNFDRAFKLTMPDINALNWDRSSLIFLLGCETAGGSLYRGMGISGLQSSFLLSGADNVLASLWRIDAAQSIQQAMDFLLAYQQTNDFISALRRTQIGSINSLRSNKYFRHPHPYFWGSYLLSHKQCFTYQ